MYSLIYPAFLGTAIVGLLNSDGGGPKLYWGILLACYFTAQHGEGTFLEFSYWRSRVLQDSLEILSLAVAFGALGMLPARVLAEWLAASPLVAPAAIIVAFAIPPVFRQCVRKEGWYSKTLIAGETKNTYFNTILSVMSGIAIITLLIWGVSMTSFVITAVIFVIYVFGFVLENHQLKPRFYWLARPEPNDSAGLSI